MGKMSHTVQERWASLQSYKLCTIYISGGFRGGPSRLRPLPNLGDGLMQSLTVMFVNAKFWSFCCGFLTAVECTKFVFGQGSTPDSIGHWGSLQRSPDPLAGLRGPTSKGEGRGGRGEREIDWLEFNGTFSTVRLYRAFRSYSLRFGK